MFVSILGLMLAAEAPQEEDNHQLPVALELVQTVSDSQGVTASRTVLVRIDRPELSCSLDVRSPGVAWVGCRQEFDDPAIGSRRVLYTYMQIDSYEIDETAGYAIVFGADALMISSRFRQRIRLEMSQPTGVRQVPST